VIANPLKDGRIAGSPTKPLLSSEEASFKLLRWLRRWTR